MHRKKSDQLRTSIRWFLGLWFCFTLPIVAVLVINAQTRLVLLETLVHYRSKVVPLQYVFIGDSITAGGRNWGMLLWSNPLAARCLAESSFTVPQIGGEAVEAIKLYHPKFIFIMAGVNDVLGHGDLDQSIHQYEEILDMIKQAHVQPVVTLVPYDALPDTTQAITDFNGQLLAFCRQRGIRVVDINPRISADGRILPQYTKDGVHFSPAAYAVWKDLLLDVLHAPPPAGNP